MASHCPAYVASGIVSIPMKNRERIEAPYIVMTHCEGQQIAYCMRYQRRLQQEEIAKELGLLVADLHTLTVHLPSTFEEQSSVHPVTGTDSVQLKDLRSALTWTQSTVTSCGAFFQAQDPNRVWSAHLRSKISLLTPPNPSHVQPSDAFTLSLEQYLVKDNEEAWSPFLKLLEWRQGMILYRPSKMHLPMHLQKQLKSFLPARMEVLLPRTDPITGTRPPPVLLHGDLTVDNILLGEKRAHHLSLIDFGDASFGDPLYDFVALSLSSLRSDPSLIDSFSVVYWNRWRESIGKDLWTAWNASRAFPLSYYVMCYTLLHEDSTMAWLFETYPDFRDLTTLGEIQERIWGSLDRSS